MDNLSEKSLYELVLSTLPVNDIQPLHKAILEECCENALQMKGIEKNKKILFLL
jgi:hypothetical protein